MSASGQSDNTSRILNSPSHTGGVGLGDGDSLTARESEILALVGRGYTTKEIAQLLHLSVYTVSNHRKHMCKKLKCQSAAELIVLAARQV